MTAPPAGDPPTGQAPADRQGDRGIPGRLGEDGAVDRVTLSLAAEFASHLTRDRRRSAHTVRAYQATPSGWSPFLGEHWGAAIDRDALAKVSQADLRAFLAARRGEGIGNVSAARELSAVRGVPELRDRHGTATARAAGEEGRAAAGVAGRSRRAGRGGGGGCRRTVDRRARLGGAAAALRRGVADRRGGRADRRRSCRSARRSA